jgi:hypothetical protein
MKVKLKWCPKCKENSVIIRVDEEGERIEICVNKGCGHIVTLPRYRNPADYNPRHPDDI